MMTMWSFSRSSKVAAALPLGEKPANNREPECEGRGPTSLGHIQFSTSAVTRTLLLASRNR